MKLWYAVFAGLLGIAATSGVAQAQWSSDRAPVWRDGDRYDGRDRLDDRFDERLDDRFDDAYGGRYGRPVVSATLARAAHALSDESASLADALHAIAPRSRIARDAMGAALVAERFHRAIESGAPPPVLVRQLRALNREMSQLMAMADFHPAGRRFPELHDQIGRMAHAFEITRDVARDELVRRGRGRRYVDDGYYGQPPYVRAVPPAVAVPIPARPRYEVRVGF